VCGFAPRIVLAVGRGFNCGVAGALKRRVIGTILAGTDSAKGSNPAAIRGSDITTSASHILQVN